MKQTAVMAENQSSNLHGLRKEQNISIHPAHGHSLWYMDAVIYEVHVRSFYDSNGDGIGDFPGLVQKLDYLQDLGVSAIWLLPFYPSPLKDGGYDISSYTEIHPDYGTLHDFKVFMQEAKRHGIKVITELVLNHTSDEHEWFRRARRADRGDPLRDFYVWSDTPQKYGQARIIFKDYETSNWAWDPDSRQYYWHRFYSHQPDLNYDNPRVRKAVLEALDFWLELGVDGFRLDAVPYLFERDGTNCENLPQTHRFLKRLRGHVDRHFPNRLLLAEANQWPEDAAAYFGEGNECHMAFHFPLMPRLFMGIRMEDRFPITDIVMQTPAIPQSCQWALFLRNHDELTLEMVTDEERDYMYRSYARDPGARINLGIRHRLAPLLGNNRRLIDMMNALLLSLPGTPVIYYGDEIGMGDNISLGDRDSVRTPMQWSSDRNAGFSTSDSQNLYLPVIAEHEYRPAAVNVAAQQANSNSLLWSMKRLIAMRKRYKAFGRGDIKFLHPQNRKILAFIRSYQDEQMLVIANLSRFMQAAELDLSLFKGSIPVEVFGRTELPPIEEKPYFFTLGPHSFYWFSLELHTTEAIALTLKEAPLHSIDATGDQQTLSDVGATGDLAQALLVYMNRNGWFSGTARRIRSIQLADLIAVPGAPHGPGGGRAAGYLSLVRVLSEGDPETFIVPFVFPAADSDGRPSDQTLEEAVARLYASEDQSLTDGAEDPEFCRALLKTISTNDSLQGYIGELSPWLARRQKLDDADHEAPTTTLHNSANSSSIIYGNNLVLKLFRRLDEGLSPELEVAQFLTDRASFTHIPPVVGGLDYRAVRRPSMTVGLLKEFVPDQVSGWRDAIDSIGRYMDQVLVAGLALREAPVPKTLRLIPLARQRPPAVAEELIGDYLQASEQIGRRTAELHLALASDSEDAAFAPEPFSSLYQRSLHQRMRGLTRRVFDVGRTHRESIREIVQILDLENDILGRFHSIIPLRPTGLRIRCHGFYDLSKLIHSGRDYFIDLEGDPAIPFSQRRIKRSALEDVACMLNSFHSAAYASLFGLTQGPSAHEDPSVLEPWIWMWYLWVSATFLRSYLATSSNAAFLPKTKQEMEVLLDLYMLERALYQLQAEMSTRPQWAKTQIRAIVQLMEPKTP